MKVNSAPVGAIALALLCVGGGDEKSEVQADAACEQREHAEPERKLPSEGKESLGRRVLEPVDAHVPIQPKCAMPTLLPRERTPRRISARRRGGEAGRVRGGPRPRLQRRPPR